MANKSVLWLIAFLLYTITNAINVPQGQPDGFYIVTIDQQGNEVHSPMRYDTNYNDTDSTISNRRDSTLYKRVTWPGGTSITCQQDYLWSDNFYQTSGAFDQFFNKCYNGFLFTSKSMYAVRGQALAYFCNYQVMTGSVCRTEEWSQFVDEAGKECTQGTNGWKQAAFIDFHGAWKKSYGFTHSANSFC